MFFKKKFSVNRFLEDITLGSLAFKDEKLNAMIIDNITKDLKVWAHHEKTLFYKTTNYWYILRATDTNILGYRLPLPMYQMEEGSPCFQLLTRTVFSKAEAQSIGKALLKKNPEKQIELFSIKKEKPQPKNHSFVDDLILLYEMQTEDEKSSETTKHLNNVGFNSCDGRILSSMAKFVLDRGFLTIKQEKIVRERIKKYRKQIESLRGGEA